MHDAYRDKADCERLAVTCYSLMDRGFYARSVALFTEDATWVRGEGPVHTSKAILASLHNRPAERITRHLVSNIVVTITGPDEAEAVAYLVALHAKRAESGPTPIPVPVAIGDLIYRFRRGADGWRISYLEPVLHFK
jgi:hypothetical protein